MYTEKLQKVYKSDKFPLLIYTAIYAIIHILMTKSIDDLFFTTACNNTNIFNFLIGRYQTWTSRIIIEGILVICCQFLPMFIWKIINIGMFYLLANSISELVIVNNKRKFNTIMCILLLAIPIDIFKEAGWMATMNNYLWVAATGIYSLTLLKKIIKDEKISTIKLITYILALIYASNQEQMAGVLFIIYSIGIVYLIKNKKHKSIIYINYAIIILQLVIALTCPGNMNRKVQEEANWYPGFSGTPITTKMMDGIVSMMDYTIESGRVVFFALILLIGFATWQKQKNKFLKLIGICPLILVIITKYALRILSQPWYFELIQNSNLYVLAKMLAYVGILILVGLGICIIFKENKTKMILASLIYFTGFVSRFVMALSPTIYASGERTSIFWYIAIVMLNILIIQEIYIKKEKENGKIQKN